MRQAVCIAVVVTLSGANPIAQSPVKDADEIIFVEPIRRAPDAPPEPAPEVPAAAERITPATLGIVIVRTAKNGRSETTRQTMTRTRDRVHLTSSNREWLFERNPVDGRRVSASLIDHRTRTIVFHDESDVRNMLGIRGWADVILIGERTTVATPTGTVRVTVGRERTEINRTLLLSPSSRLRDYKVIDLAEWLEER